MTAPLASRPHLTLAQTQPLLQVQDLDLEYRTRERRVRATHQVSFEVHGADRFVLLGPSGCGKSSLLKSVAGFLPPLHGEIRLDGQPIKGPGPDRIVVFQEFDQLPPWKTVLENTMFPLLASRQASRGEARERALHYLDKVGLARFVDAYPHHLSGGMKQRVAIARALAMEPEVILFDEPTSALDPELVGEVLATIRGLAEEKRTMIIVTHEMSFARDVANRVIFFDKGVIVEQGEAKALFANPKEERTRQFLSKFLAH